MRRLGNSLKQRRGATATETIILVLLVAMVVLASIKVLRDNLGNKVEEANTHVSAVSLEREDPDEVRRRRNAKEASQEAQGHSSAQASQDDSTGSRSGDDVSAASGGGAGDVGEAPVGADGEPPADEGGGFNPFIIPIVLGLLGLLGYVIAKTKKG